MSKEIKQEVLDKARELMDLCEKNGYSAITGLYDSKSHETVNAIQGFSGDALVLCAKIATAVAKETGEPIENVAGFLEQCICKDELLYSKKQEKAKHEITK